MGPIGRRRGFGSVRVKVQFGATTWSTSLFPDKAARSYVLPIRRSVRDQEELAVGDLVQVTLRVVVD